MKGKNNSLEIPVIMTLRQSDRQWSSFLPDSKPGKVYRGKDCCPLYGRMVTIDNVDHVGICYI